MPHHTAGQAPAQVTWLMWPSGPDVYSRLPAKHRHPSTLPRPMSSPYRHGNHYGVRQHERSGGSAANSDLQVWLQSESSQPPGIVVPYVLSPSDTALRYSIGIISRGPSGRSEIRQGGTVWLHAGTPTPLSRISINPSAAANCVVNLALNQEGKPQRHYDFDCSARVADE